MVLGLVGIFAVLVVLALLGVVAAGVVAAMQLAKKSKADYDAGNVTVPGRSDDVPDSWGGSHDPEAVLHRRLVAAMRALDANQVFDDDGGLLDLRVELEHQATTLDQRLVALAPLTATRKAEPLAAAEADVDRIEAAVADLAVRSASDARPSLDAATDRLKERTDLITDAMADLDSPAAAPTVETGHVDPGLVAPASAPAPAPLPPPDPREGETPAPDATT